MAYAAVSDLSALVARQTWDPGPNAQPSQAAVEDWLEEVSGWIDATLRWRYEVPVTAAADLKILRQVCSMLTVARVWDTLLSRTVMAGKENPGRELRRAAYELLAYDSKTGRSSVTLPATTLADDGEAELGQPQHSFTDPDADGTPRLFSIGMSF